MIELAMVSGRENMAYLYEDQAWFSYAEDVKAPAHPSQVHRVVNGGGEYKVLRNTSDEQVKSLLFTENNKANALFMVLSMFDLDVSISSRVLIAGIAHDLLLSEEIRFFVSQRVLSWPLPSGTIGNRRSLMEVGNSFPIVSELLHQVFDAQPILDEIKSCGSKQPNVPRFQVEQSRSSAQN